MNPQFFSDGACVLLAEQLNWDWMAPSWSWLAAAALVTSSMLAVVIFVVRQRTSRWLPVTAQVSACKVLVDDVWLLGPHKRMTVEYIYTYEVDGVKHHGIQSVTRAKGADFNARQHARNIVREGKMQVYYHESRPSLSRLRPPHGRATAVRRAVTASKSSQSVVCGTAA